MERNARESRRRRRPTSETRGAGGACARACGAADRDVSLADGARAEAREWRLVIGRKLEPSGERSEEHAPGTRETVEYPGDFFLENAGLARRRLQKPRHAPFPALPSTSPDGHHARYRHAPRALHARHVPPAAPAVAQGLPRDEQEPERRPPRGRGGRRAAQRQVLQARLRRVEHPRVHGQARGDGRAVRDGGVPPRAGVPRKRLRRAQARRQHRERPPPRRRYASFVPSDKKRGAEPRRPPPRESDLITPPSSVATQV